MVTSRELIICKECRVEMRPKTNGISCHFGNGITYRADLWQCKSCGIEVAFTGPGYMHYHEDQDVESNDIVMMNGRSDEFDNDPIQERREAIIDNVYDLTEKEGSSPMLIGKDKKAQADFADAIVGLVPSPTGYHVAYIRSSLIKAIMAVQGVTKEAADDFYVNIIVHAEPPVPDINSIVLIEDVK